MNYIFFRNPLARSGLKKLLILPIFLILGFIPNISSLFAEFDLRGDRSINYFSRYGRTRLQLSKTLFEPGENIPVKFRIKNKGYTTIRIYPSFFTGKTFMFQVTDMAGRELTMLAEAWQDRTDERGEPIKQIFGDLVKEIILHPGESFEKEILLNKLYKFEPGGEYRIRGYFYPDYRRKFFTATVNVIKVRLATRGENNRGKELFNRELSYDSMPQLSPEETVYLFLSAEMRKNWKNYLKYLEIRKYITAYDRFASHFASASVIEKPRILKRFAMFLRGEPADSLKHFKIIKKEFDRTGSGEIKESGRAYITVHAERESKGYSVLFNYVYSLERVRNSPGFWKITHVTANIIR